MWCSKLFIIHLLSKGTLFGSGRRKVKSARLKGGRYTTFSLAQCENLRRALPLDREPL
jgi:hypothetical protein